MTDNRRERNYIFTISTICSDFLTFTLGKWHSHCEFTDVTLAREDRDDSRAHRVSLRDRFHWCDPGWGVSKFSLCINKRGRGDFGYATLVYGDEHEQGTGHVLSIQILYCININIKHQHQQYNHQPFLVSRCWWDCFIHSSRSSRYLWLLW